MKTTILFFATFFILSSSCSGSSKKTVFVSNSEEVILKICANTTKNELDSIKTVLDQGKKIEFDFSKTTFNSQDHITVLDYTIKGNGFKAHENADIYMSNEYHGFIRDYRKNAEKPFRCGTLE